MGLHHGHHHHHADHSVRRNLGKAFFLNTFFLAIECVGALFTGSVAIWASVIHDIGDSITIGLSYFFEKLASRDPNERYTYGYARFSLFSSVIAGVVICSTNIFLLIESFKRFSEPHVPLSGGMSILAILGIVINGYAAFSLKEGKSQHEKVITWHFIEDMSGWIAVLIGAVVIKIFGFTWVDPLLAIILAAFVSFSVLRHLVTSVEIFFQQTPKDFPMNQFEAELKKIKSLTGYHDIHVWSLDGKHNVLTLHVIVDDFEQSSTVKEAVRDLCKTFGIVHTTVEIDGPKEECYYMEGHGSASHAPEN